MNDMFAEVLNYIEVCQNWNKFPDAKESEEAEQTEETPNEEENTETEPEDIED